MFFVFAIPMLGKETTDYSATALIKFIEGSFHKRVRLRCDGKPATVAFANKVKLMAGDLVKLETTPKHSSASNPAERAVQAFVQIARCALAMVKHLELTNQFGRGCCVMLGGKSVDTSRRGME